MKGLSKPRKNNLMENHQQQLYLCPESERMFYKLQLIMSWISLNPSLQDFQDVEKK